MRVLSGRYGPYIKHGATNANVPKGKDPAAYFLLRVPQFFLQFVGYYDDQGKLMLASVWPSDEFDFKVGVATPAEDVLRLLKPAAQGYSGGPLNSRAFRQSR